MSLSALSEPLPTSLRTRLAGARSFRLPVVGTCSACGDRYDTEYLDVHEDGSVCLACASDQEAAASWTAAARSQTIQGPLTLAAVIATSVTLAAGTWATGSTWHLAPGVLGAVVYGALAVFGSVLALAGVLEAWRARTAGDGVLEVSSGTRAGLIAAGVAHAVSGASIVAGVAVLSVLPWVLA